MHRRSSGLRWRKHSPYATRTHPRVPRFRCNHCRSAFFRHAFSLGYYRTRPEPLGHSPAAHRRETIAFGRRLDAILERLMLTAVWRNFVKRMSERRGDPTTPAMRPRLTDRPWGRGRVPGRRLFPQREGLEGVWLELHRRVWITPELPSNARHRRVFAYRDPIPPSRSFDQTRDCNSLRTTMRVVTARRSVLSFAFPAGSEQGIDRLSPGDPSRLP